ncbi:hypothetical protein [Streptomyces sp. NBC_01431]|uniref:hypothetical protein n=1 Tax=Streptomyces sp. NBC_01431 TaxID=2903863 RepID=UPI002E3673EC|nr:hypothetical protein [Streptomyces sp. NBC_01431]
MKQALSVAPEEEQPQYRPADHVVVSAVMALETPKSADAVAAAIDLERGLAPVTAVSQRTSVGAVHGMLRQMASEGRVTGMRPVEWHDRGVRVPGCWGKSDWWWPTYKWEQVQNARSQRQTSGPLWSEATENRRQRKQPPEKSGVAEAVDRVIAANEAHYQAHKNDFGPGAS